MTVVFLLLLSMTRKSLVFHVYVSRIGRKGCIFFVIFSEFYRRRLGARTPLTDPSTTNIMNKIRNSCFKQKTLCIEYRMEKTPQTKETLSILQRS